jgi:hypothetical protein
VALLCLGSFVVFVAPGVFVARAALGREPGWLSAVAFGAVVGLGVSALALLALWGAGARGLWTLVVAPLLAAALVVPARSLQGRLTFARLDRRDARAICLVALLVPLVVGLPFYRVGSKVPDGRAYRAYFTADYVWRMAVVAELAKGDFPPKNPFYKGDTLHYYWLPHLQTGVQYRGLRQGATLDELLLCHSVLVDLAFVVFLYAFGRQFVRSRAGVGLAVASVVLFTSFEGSYLLYYCWHRPRPLDAVRYLNVDAVDRWFFYGMPIDGLQRLLLYQPHHASAYALGVLALLVVARRGRARDGRVMLAAGVLLALNALLSTFSALMLTAAIAVYEVCGVVRHLDVRRAVVHGLAGAVPLGVALALARALQYADLSQGSLTRIGLNPAALSNALVSIPLSLGPVLLAGCAGVCVAMTNRRRGSVVIAAFVAAIAFFYLFVDVIDHQGVYVGWRAGHLMLIALVPLIGLAIEAAWSLRPALRATACLALALLALLAAPMTVMDLYNTQDITNRARGPRFRWTLVLTHAELFMLNWIKANTPPDAIVQVDPTARDSDTWAYLPAFAERRMAVGLPISMIPRAKYVRGSDDAHAVFAASSAREAYERARRLGIEYLLVGPPEMASAPDVDLRFDSGPEFFTKLVRTRELLLYRVNPTAP